MMSKTMWLVRATWQNYLTKRVRQRACEYLLYAERPSPRERGWSGATGWPEDEELFAMCSYDFERATGIKLPPGGGPIEVKLQVVKKAKKKKAK